MTTGGEKWEGSDGSGLGNVAYYVGQMMFAPFRTLIYGMETFLDAVRGMQRLGDKGMHLLAGGVPGRILPRDPGTESAGPALETSGAVSAAVGGGSHECEESEPMDKDLNDDMLKLIRYKILFVKRDYEHAFPEEEELVSDNMDSSAYTAWKVAQFVQSLQHGKTVPHKWGKIYPEGHRKDGIFTGLPEGDKKYLRVFYEVMERYPREKLKYEEDQLTALREIRDAIKNKNEPDGSAAGGPVIDAT